MAANNGYWALVMRALMEAGDIASIYTQLENPDNFYIGHIAHVTGRQFSVRAMDIDGTHDGWLIGRNSDVVQVIAGDDYEVRMRWLENLQESPAPADPLDEDCDDLFTGYARAAMKSGVVVTVWPEGGEEEITGYVLDVNDLHIKLAALDFFGQDTGERVVSAAKLELMSVDAMEERMFMRMHENVSPMSPLRLL